MGHVIRWTLVNFVGTILVLKKRRTAVHPEHPASPWNNIDTDYTHQTNKATHHRHLKMYWSLLNSHDKLCRYVRLSNGEFKVSYYHQYNYWQTKKTNKLRWKHSTVHRIWKKRVNWIHNGSHSSKDVALLTGNPGFQSFSSLINVYHAFKANVSIKQI